MKQMIVAALVLSSLVRTQDKAAKEQLMRQEQRCHAEVMQWGNEGEQKNLPLQTVRERREEMHNCAMLEYSHSLDDDAHVACLSQSVCQTTHSFYVAIMESRERHFLERHHLMEQFEREDKAGQR